MVFTGPMLSMASPIKIDDPVTLRLRLVAALLVLLVAGLAVFGVGTYSLFANSQRDRLDQQLRSSLPSLQRIVGDDRGGGPARVAARWDRD